MLLSSGTPIQKPPMKEADVFQALPSKPKTLKTMLITSVLSSRATSPLGKFDSYESERNYQHDDVALTALAR